MQAANTPTDNHAQEQLIARLPLMWISLAFLVGIVLAKQVSLDALVWIALVVISILLVVLSQILAARLPASFPLHPFAFILLCAFCLGALRYQMSVPRFDAFHIAFYNDRDYDLIITGTLSEPPDYRDNYTNLRLSVSAVDTGGNTLPVHGLLLARVSDNQVFHYGDIVRLRGKLKTPPENEDFSYQDYLAAQQIHSYMSSAEVTVLP